MTKHEVNEIVDALCKIVWELERCGGTVPAPLHIEDGALWLVTKHNGMQYKKPICKLVTK